MIRLRGGEVARLRIGAHGLFRQAQALIGNGCGQNRVFRRVDYIDPAAHDRECAGFQAGLMRRRVDPARQPRHNGIARQPQPFGQHPRHACAKAGCVARPHKGHHGLQKRLAPTHAPQHRRGICNGGKAARIGLCPEAQHARALGAGQFNFGLRLIGGEGRVAIDPSGLGDLRKCIKRGLRRAMFAHQAVKGGWPHARGANETKPR